MVYKRFALVTAITLILVSCSNTRDFSFRHKLVPFDTNKIDLFGRSVSVNGNTAIVGAILDDENGNGSGSAYVFDLITGRLRHKLIAPDGSRDDYFGESVSISGNTAIVGAFGDNENGKGSSSGSAYVFDLITGRLRHKLVAPDGSQNDYFGANVSISGNTAIVGAYGDDNNNQIDTGSAYIFDVATGKLLHKLVTPNGSRDDYFGISVSISGNTAIVGASGDNNNASNAGSVYIFDVVTGKLLHKLVAPNGSEDDNFGISVCVSENIAIVGAFGDNGKGVNIGSAYVFDVSDGSLLAKLVAPNGNSYEQFGSNVSISGNTAIVGTTRDDDNGSSGSSAYIFDVATGEFLTKLVAPDSSVDGGFNASVSISDNKVVIGGSRSAYVYTKGLYPNF